MKCFSIGSIYNILGSECKIVGLRILQLSKKFPYPLRDGESIAINYLSNALHDLGAEISLLAMNTTKHYIDASMASDCCSHYQQIRTVLVDNKLKIWDAFINLFSLKPYHITRFISKEYKRELIDFLSINEYDIIQLETLYLTPYIPIIRKYSMAKICMRAHNIEYEIWDRVGDNTSNLIKKWYIKHLTKKLKEYEIEHLNDYDFLVSVSRRDLNIIKSLGYKNGAMSSPIGLNISKYRKQISSSKDICFIGALDWIPNKEGLLWFIDKVWPILSVRNPDIKLHIAGRNIAFDIKRLVSERIIIHGEVEDAIDYIGSYGIMIVPLLSGSGTRVKILEGMLLQKPIVTTSIGVEGIEVTNNKHLLIADSPIEFADAIQKFRDDPDFYSRVSMEARKFILEHYDDRSNAQKLLENYHKIVSDDYMHLEV